MNLGLSLIHYTLYMYKTCINLRQMVLPKDQPLMVMTCHQWVIESLYSGHLDKVLTIPVVCGGLSSSDHLYYYMMMMWDGEVDFDARVSWKVLHSLLTWLE